MSEHYPVSGEFRAVEFEETFSLEKGPIDLIAGSNNRLRIIDPALDLTEEDRTALQTSEDCVVVDLDNFDPTTGVGYLPLSADSSTTIGRAHNIPGVFELTGQASRHHAKIKRDGSQITVVDLASTNGTLCRQVEQRNDATRTVQPVSGTAELPSGVFDAASVASRMHPLQNQDSYFIDESNMAFGVFDGVASAEGSALAATVAAETIQKSLAELPTQVPRALGQMAMREALNSAHRAIVNSDPQIKTTAAVVKVLLDDYARPYAVIGTAGDSRVYLNRGRRLDSVTLDHAYIMKDLNDHEKRTLQNTLARATREANLSVEEQAAFRKRNTITSFLGGVGRTPTISLSEIDIHAKDRLIVTSDGIHDNLNTKEIAKQVKRHPDDIIAHTLVTAAVARSRQFGHYRAKADDMTAVTLRVN